MKKLLLFMALTLAGLTSCEDKPQPFAADNSLSAEQKQAGVFTAEVMWKMKRAGGAALSPDGGRLLYQAAEYSVEQNRGCTSLYVMDMTTREVRRLTDCSSNNSSAQWDAEGKHIYFLSDRGGSSQIWRMDADGKHVKRISSLDGDVEGFGVAPDGKHAFYVQRVHVCDRRSSDVYKDMDKSDARIYDDLMCRHWDYWDEGEYMHVFVSKMRGGKISAGEDIVGADAAWDAPLAPYFDMAEIAWSADGRYLAYTCKPLTGSEYAVSTDSDIFVYDTESGETENICKGSEYEDMRDNPSLRWLARFVGYDKYPVFSPDGNYIAFRSQSRPGNESDKERLILWNRLYAVPTDITLDFDYNAMNVVWADDRTIYFIAPIEATHQICRVTADGKGVEVLTSGDHDINAFTMAAGRIVAEVTTMAMATEFFEVDPQTGGMERISDINGEIYDNIRMGEIRKRWVETTDGKQMLTWVILPPDFDPAKKYPALLYCQGGPQSVVSQFWSYRWNMQLMAAQGYIVVAPNRRGLPSFGQEWLDQISGDYSGQNIRDYLSAIDDVAREPWCDETRLGCVGASYGGYSVYFLAGCHEKRFKAFVAHCGIFNFESMYGETEELFFINNDYGGAYWDKQNAVAMRSYANSPHKFVDKWDTPILIVTGERDFRIPYTQSLQAFTAARMHGIDSRLVEFESEAHQVFKPQNSIVWNREFFGWLDKYLK